MNRDILMTIVLIVVFLVFYLSPFFIKEYLLNKFNSKKFNIRIYSGKGISSLIYFGNYPSLTRFSSLLGYLLTKKFESWGASYAVVNYYNYDDYEYEEINLYVSFLENEGDIRCLIKYRGNKAEIMIENHPSIVPKDHTSLRKAAKEIRQIIYNWFRETK